MPDEAIEAATPTRAIDARNPRTAARELPAGRLRPWQVAAFCAFALAVFLGALSVLALRRVVLARWLGWFGLVTTVLLLIPPVGWAALLFLLPLWLIAASVFLWRRSTNIDERRTVALDDE
jgi:hypothetical protein